MKTNKIGKREKLRIKQEEKINAFNEFCSIRKKIEQNLIMGSTLLGRIEDLYYSKTTYQRITHLLNFFYQFFYVKNNNYKCKIYYMLKDQRPCLAVILDDEWMWGYYIRYWKTKDIYMYADYKGTSLDEVLVYKNSSKEYLG